ncbi:glutaredoxin 3 [Marinobacterium rhizophilum]|uniref:glutaredoxin 3 n=1 Tax=Marinobacterium rhizophilum TaxID=420402 RepID=UPI000367EA96|nr:glutaredoxin 3 [Marinobacterium rhizophilum]
MNDILIYTTAWCPFCIRAKMLLDRKGATYTEIKVDEEPAKRVEMMQRSNRRTVPQIFFGDSHIGGCDELYSLERQSKLDALLA